MSGGATTALHDPIITPLPAQAYVEKAQGEEELMEAKRVAAALRVREAQALAAVEVARRAAAEAAERERQQAIYPSAPSLTLPGFRLDPGQAT